MLNTTSNTRAKIACDKAALEQSAQYQGQLAGLNQSVAVKEAISQTLQKQNRDQQATINGCLTQAMGLLAPEPMRITPLALDNESKDGIKKIRWLVLVNKSVTPVQMNVICNKTLENEASVWIAGSGLLGGGANKVAPNVVGVNVSTPAWSATSPMLVSMSYRGDKDDLSCSFIPR